MIDAQLAISDGKDQKNEVSHIFWIMVGGFEMVGDLLIFIHYKFNK